MNGNNISLKIVEALIKSDEALILQHIAKKIGETPQTTAYNLKKLCDMGIVICIDGGNNKQYLVQPFYYMEDTLNSLYVLLKPFAETINKLLDDCAEKDRLDYTTNNLELIFELFIKDFKNSN